VTLRLVVDTEAWERHITTVADSIPGLVPVVKGNGYGFGRRELARRASKFADTIAVGTIHELDVMSDTGDDVDVVVLTPALRPPADRRAIVTVGSAAHIAALGTWTGRVLVKLVSSMQRYGADPGLIEIAERAGLEVVGVSIHPPLAGSAEDHRAEIEHRLTEVPPTYPVWISHLDAETYRRLPRNHSYRLRLGTSLWHGDKSMLRLAAEVLEVRPVRAGHTVGYRQHPISADGALVMIGAGSAHGVQPLPDGRSPFHFARRRLDLVEPPHMHTSMAFVPAGEPTPLIGEDIDVQRPLTTTDVDVIDWR